MTNTAAQQLKTSMFVRSWGLALNSTSHVRCLDLLPLRSLKNLMLIVSQELMVHLYLKEINKMFKKGGVNGQGYGKGLQGN